MNEPTDPAAELPAQGAFSDADWSEMVLRLAHEIRNPLATIKSGVQLVQHIDRPTGDTAECLNTVLTQVQRIDKTVGDLQRFVRIQRGEVRGAAVASIAQEAVDSRQEEARRAGVRLLVTGGPPVECHIAPGNLEQALGELLSNAVWFSPPGGTASISWRASGEELCLIHVEDEGPGVDPAIADRISRPFFSTLTQGTGLGLNIAAKICALAGGTMDWQNLPGGGCRFTLSLPRS